MDFKNAVNHFNQRYPLMIPSDQLAWGSIRAALVEGQKPPTNTQIKQALREIAERLNDVSEVADSYAPGTMKVELQAVAQQLLNL